MVSTKPTSAKTLILRDQFFGLRLDNNDVFLELDGSVGLLKSRLYELRDAELDEAPSSKGPGSGRWWCRSWCLVAPSWEPMIPEAIVRCGFVFGTSPRVKVGHLHCCESERTRGFPGGWDLDQVEGASD